MPDQGVQDRSVRPHSPGVQSSTVQGAVQGRPGRARNATPAQLERVREAAPSSTRVRTCWPPSSAELQPHPPEIRPPEEMGWGVLLIRPPVGGQSGETFRLAHDLEQGAGGPLLDGACGAVPARLALPPGGGDLGGRRPHPCREPDSGTCARRGARPACGGPLRGQRGAWSAELEQVLVGLSSVSRAGARATKRRRRSRREILHLVQRFTGRFPVWDLSMRTMCARQALGGPCGAV